MSLNEDISRVLLQEGEIARKVDELGAEVTRLYAPTVKQDGPLRVVVILKGAAFFAADLMRRLDLPVTLDFMAISSYGKHTSSSGVVRILKDLESSVDGAHVLVVEDIIDTGLSLKFLLENLRARGPASVRSCVLLDKPERREVDVRPDFLGFDIPDEFVVGYGLDYAEKYRNLPYIGVLKPSLIQA